MILIKEPIEFIWDKGNRDKNWIKHHVANNEIEETFFDEDKKIFPDNIHSGKEERLIMLGKTKNERIIFVVFTVRNSKIRIISARDINKKERSLYEKTD